jgi:pimeloyl-ACP methyl ester carboxylesterase
MLDRLFDPLMRKMLHPPVRPARPLSEALAARVEDVTIPGAAMPLKGWLVRPTTDAVGIAVFVHGWSSDGGRLSPLAAAVVERGVAVLLVDLPGHGRTGPVPTYNAHLMVLDLKCVGDWVAKRSDLAALPAAILGYSFGGLGAYVSAARDPRWQALVLIAAPLGPMQATRLYLDGKGLPGKFLVKMMRRSAIRTLGVDPDDYDASRNLPRLAIPVLVVHGEDDRVVPVAHGEGLAALVPAGRGTFVRVPGAGHNDPIGDPAVGARVAAFLADHLASREMTKERRG